MIKANNEIAAEFLQLADKEIKTTFDGMACSREHAIEVLTKAKMFENGIVVSDNEYWFSGTFEDKAFVFSIIGKDVALQLQKLTFAQCSTSKEGK